MKFVLAFSILIFSSLSFANTDDGNFSNISDYNYNTVAFKNTVALCSQIKTNQQNLQVNWAMLQFFFTGIKSGVKLWGPDAIQVSAPTAKLIQSDGYKAALYHCYGDNELWRRAFTTTVIFDDATGHLVGFGAWLIPSSAVVRAFKVATVGVTTPEVAAALGRTFGAIQKVGLLAFTSYVGWVEYQKYERRKNQSEELTKATDSIVDSTQVQNDDTYKILQILLNNTNKELAENPSEVKREILLRKKALLENQINRRPQN